MAFFHAHFDVVSRSQGQNAISAAAYSGGVQLQKLDGVMADYSKKRNMHGGKIILPSHVSRTSTPSVQWVWEQAEMAESRKNSTVARKGDLSLPQGLSLQEYFSIGHSFGQDIADRYGVIVNVNFHELAKKNPHIDIMWTTREFDGEKLTVKTRILDDKRSGPKEIVWLREQWAKRVNEKLVRLGQSIDPRSYKEQGSEKLVQKHLGRKAAALERQGIETEIGKYNRKVREHNQFLDEKEKLDSEIASLEAEIMEGHHVTKRAQPTKADSDADGQSGSAAKAYAYYPGRGTGTDAPSVAGPGDREGANHHSGRAAKTRHTPLVLSDTGGTDATMRLADNALPGDLGQNHTDGERRQAISRPAGTGDEVSREYAKGHRPADRGNQPGTDGCLQPVGQSASGQGQAPRRDPESGAAIPEATRRSNPVPGNTLAPAGWDRPLVSPRSRERLVALAGAIERRCGAIAGTATMTALEGALRKQHGAALTPLAPREHALIISTEGIQALVSKLSAQTVVAAIHRELRYGRWDSPLRRPPVCLEKHAGLLEFASLCREAVRRLSGMYTAQTLEKHLRANAGWEFLHAPNAGLLPPGRQTPAKCNTLSQDIGKVISMLSASLTASAIREALHLEDDPSCTLSAEENQHVP